MEKIKIDNEEMKIELDPQQLNAAIEVLESIKQDFGRKQMRASLIAESLVELESNGHLDELNLHDAECKVTFKLEKFTYGVVKAEIKKALTRD